ncbi:hypothetical protein GCM10027190_44010 [Spirosoma areae]
MLLGHPSACQFQVLGIGMLLLILVDVLAVSVHLFEWHNTPQLVWDMPEKPTELGAVNPKYMEILYLLSFM